MTYTADSDMATIIDKNGSTWNFAYTTNNGRLLSVADPLAQVEQFDFFNGLPGQQLGNYTDVRGKTWTHTFLTAKTLFGDQREVGDLWGERLKLRGNGPERLSRRRQKQDWRVGAAKRADSRRKRSFSLEARGLMR